MRTSRTRTGVAAVVCVCVNLGLAVSAASANRLSFSSQTFRSVWSSMEFMTSLATVRCNVTIEGSLHEAVTAKIRDGLIGYVTSAAARHACTGGEVFIYNGTETLPDTTRPNSLPWHKQYEAFSGVLTSFLTTILARLLGVKLLYRVTVLGITAECEYTTEAVHPLRLLLNLDSGGRITGMRVNEAVRIPASRSRPVACPDLSIAGTGVVTVPGSATSVTIRLA